MSIHIPRLWSSQLLDAHKPLNPAATVIWPSGIPAWHFPEQLYRIRKSNDKVTQILNIVAFHKYNLSNVNFLFDKNDRDKNINIAFENSCKIRTINIKANWTCCSIISFIVSACISIFSFIIAALWNTRTKMKERYAVYKYNSSLSLWKFCCLYISITVVSVYENFKNKKILFFV